MTKGFSLVEILLYVAILAIVGGLFVGILIVSARIQVNEAANNEIANQLNFVLQTIQRLVRESSAVIVNNNGDVNDDTTPIGSPYSYLVLRMRDSAGASTDRDPIVIWNDNGIVKIKQGASQVVSDLTTSRVLVPVIPTNGLAFTKFTNYPGHDSVQIDLTLTYAGSNPAIARRLQTAIGRVSAATFDSDLLPGGNRNVGQAGNRWQNGYFENLTVGNDLGTAGYLRFTRGGADPPIQGDCTDNERGRLYLRTKTTSPTAYELYICIGGTRFWDKISLSE